MSEVIMLSPKSCPMCGSKKYRHFRQFSKTEWGYECGKCGLSTGKYSSKEEAIIAWNYLPRKLKWTNERPTQEGWYWCREKNSMLDKYELIGVIHWSKYGGGFNTSQEFAGPIPLPIE